MDFFRRTKQEYEIIDLCGDITSIRDSITFKELLDSIIAEGALKIAINFERAKTFSSDLINATLGSCFKLKEMNGSLVMIGSNVNINETLEIVGASVLMSIFLDEKSFEEACLKK
jgi:anti-anti-sigma regulatory factor